MLAQRRRKKLAAAANITSGRLGAGGSVGPNKTEGHDASSRATVAMDCVLHHEKYSHVLMTQRRSRRKSPSLRQLRQTASRESVAAGACAFAAEPADNPPSAQKNGRPVTKGQTRYDPFKITLSFQWPATAFARSSIWDFRSNAGRSAAKCLPASRGA